MWSTPYLHQPLLGDADSPRDRHLEHLNSGTATLELSDSFDDSSVDHLPPSMRQICSRCRLWAACPQLLRGCDESESATVMSNWLTTAQTPRLHHVSQIRPKWTVECQQIGTKTTRLPPPHQHQCKSETMVYHWIGLVKWTLQCINDAFKRHTTCGYLWRSLPTVNLVENDNCGELQILGAKLHQFVPPATRAGSISWSRNDFLNSLLLSHCVMSNARSSCDTSLSIDKFFCHTNDFLLSFHPVRVTLVRHRPRGDTVAT